MNQTEDVLSKIALTEDQAKDTLAYIVSQKLRWGKQYTADDVGLAKLLDCLIVLAYAENGEAAELRKSLATANRARGAAEAREARQKIIIADLRTELELTQKALKLSGHEFVEDGDGLTIFEK